MNRAEFHKYDDFWRAFFNVIYQLLGILLFFALTMFLIYRLFILPRKLKHRLAQVQLQGVKAQLNPHFLFNSMASIQSLMNQEKIAEANRYLSELSDLLRYHLDAGVEDMVPLSEELAALQHYCELENLRSPFELSLEVDASLNPDHVEIPSQLLQPLVENAIKHGLKFAEDPRLQIRIDKMTEMILITVTDNGPGIFSKEPIAQHMPILRKTHKGIALIKEKVKLLNKKGMKLEVRFADRQKDLNQQNSGTEVRIEIPIKY